jgi:hypothetical protein
MPSCRDLTSGSRRKTTYKLKHSNLNMLFYLLKLHNLVPSLSYKDIYQHGALIHVIIRNSGAWVKAQYVVVKALRY